MYFSQSSAVDVKVYLTNRLISPAINAVHLAVKVAVTAQIAVLFAAPESQVSPSFMTFVWITIFFGVANDLAYYIVHRVSHESPLFWPFHKLHHSAEYLTPLTAKRNHPVFDLVFKIFSALLTGIAGGVIFGVFGVADIVMIFGVSLTIAFFNFAGGALRHSHIWIDYGPVLDRIFISPAQHQIHHSSAPRHHDKNYGLILAIWDWMFGTLYVPRGREELEFGIADENGTLYPQPHPNLKSALMVPFQEAGEVLGAAPPPTKEAMQ